MPTFNNGRLQFKAFCSKLRGFFHSRNGRPGLYKSKANHLLISKPQLISTTNAPFDSWCINEVLIPTEEDASTIVSSDSTYYEDVKGDDFVVNIGSFLQDTAMLVKQGSPSEDRGGLVYLSSSDDEDTQSDTHRSEESTYSPTTSGCHTTVTTPLIYITFVNPPNYPADVHVDNQAKKSYEFSINLIGVSNRLGPFLDAPRSAWDKTTVESCPPVSTHTSWTPPPVRVRPPARSTIALDPRPTSLSTISYRRRGRARAAVPQAIAEEDEQRVQRVTGEGPNDSRWNDLAPRDIGTLLCCSPPRDSLLSAVVEEDWEMGTG
ncbi:hypothetical protein V8B97DRAFT_1600229 [Scleroderma yunnanense]